MNDRITASAFTLIWEPWCETCRVYLHPFKVSMTEVLCLASPACPTCGQQIWNEPLIDAMHKFWRGTA